MFSSFIFLALLLLLLPSFLLSGHIYTQPAEFNPQNAKQVRRFNFFLLFETSLASGEYIYVKFPFLIGALTVSQLALENISGGINTALQDLARLAGTDPEHYFALVNPVLAGQWYRLTVIVDSSKLADQTVGAQGCVKVETTSGSGEDRIIYDSNACVEYISLGPLVDTTLFKVEGSYSVKNTAVINTFGQAYTAFFDVRPSFEIEGGSIIELTIDGTDFSFGSSCASVSCSIASAGAGSDCPGAYDIPLVTSTCVATAQILTFNLNQKFTFGGTFRIQATIINSNTLIASAKNIYAVHKSRKAETWFSYTTVTSSATNGLSLKTSYPSITVQNAVTLFWGLTYAQTQSVGCPIYLYRTNTINVFNSITSSITISTQIQSLPKPIYNIVMSWYPVDNANAGTLVMSSLSTNFPFISGRNSVNSCSKVTTTSAPVLDYITCKYLDSIPSGTYKISVKIELTSGNTYSSVGVGKIEFKTGESSPTSIASGSAVVIGIKKNMEYLDDGFTKTTLIKVQLNQVYSYKKDDLALTPLVAAVSGKVLQATRQAMNIDAICYFLADSCLSPKVGRAGVWAKPSTDADTVIHGVFIPIVFAVDGTSNEGPACLISVGAQLSCKTADHAAVMLKIIFNNNVLNIPSGDFTKGAYLVGTMFAKMDSVDIHASMSGTVKDYNVDANSNFISSTASFYHLTIVCKTTSTATDYSCFTSTKLDTSGSMSGISLYNTKITNYPSNYVDDKVFDFIICFKGITYASFTLGNKPTEESWTLLEKSTVAGPGMINAYVITGVPTKSYLSYANYYQTTSSSFGPGDAFATYVRAYAYFESGKIPKAASNIGIFLDGTGTTASTLLAKYSNENYVSIVNHVAGSQTTAAVLNGKQFTNLPDYWFYHTGVRFSGTVSTSESYVNVYIPMKSGCTQWTVANIVFYDALNSNTQQYPVNGVFRVFGSIFGNTAATAGGATADFTSLSSGTTNSYSAVETTAYQSTSNNCFGANVKTGFSDSASMKPGVVYDKTLIKINADVSTNAATSCAIKDGNDRTSTSMKIGSIFAIYAAETENIFTQSAKLTWDYEGTSVNKCIYHNFGIYSDGVATTNFFTILCQADAVAMEFGSSSKGVTFSTFTTPFYWGESYSIGKKLYYVWSNSEGTGVAAIKESAASSAWVHKTCSVGAISGVSQDTKDVSYQLNVNTQVSYRLPKATGTVDSLTPGKVNFIMTVAATAPSFISCEHSALVCTLSSQTITLNNYDPLNEYILSKGSVAINLVVDTPVMTKTTHSCVIKYSDVTIEYCSTEGTLVSYDLTATSQTSVISLDKNPKFINMKGARGTFSFSFVYTRPIRKGYVFIFNLGFFVGPTATSKNFRCIITTQNGVLSNNFLSLSTKDLTRSTLTVKNNLLSGGTFIYRCVGGSTSDFSQNSQNPITATYERVSPAASIGSTTDETKIHVISNILDSASASITLQKMYRTAGFDSDYLINFIPAVIDIGLIGRIIVEFSQCIMPKLNRGGIAECYINEIPAFCQLLDERRVSTWPNVILRKNSTKAYTLRIAGVTQPTEVDGNGQLYFALDADNNAYNGISEQTFIADIFETTISLPTIIYVQDFAITSNLIRTTSSISIQILLPANTVILNGILYAQFPSSFGKSLFYSSSASCSVKRIGDTTGSEYARSCSLLRGRRFVISLSADSVNTIPLNYTVTFGNLLNPQNVNSLYFREDIRIFTLSTDNITILSTTAVGNRNSSVYLSFTNGPNTLLSWYDSTANLALDYIDVNIGLYKSIPALGTFTGDKFNNTFTWQFGGNNISSFVTQQLNNNDQSLVKVVTGFSKSSFYIGARESVTPGIYYLSTTKSGDVTSTYSQIPFMDIRAVITPCSITIPGNTYNVPVGGYSAPIPIDFNKCIPMTDVTLTANLTSGAKFFMKFENGMTTHSQTLKYDTISSNYMMYFYVSSEIGSSNLTSGSSTIDFVLSGTDGPYISLLSQVSVALIPPSTDIPIVQNPQVTAAIGTTTISFACSQAGNIYFALGLGGSSSKVPLTAIIAATQKVKVSLTKPIEDDANYLVMGFINYPQANIYQGVEIANRLKAGDNYTVVTYCVNQNSVQSSNAGSSVFIQPDNGAKTLSITFNYKNTTLTDKQRQDISCGIARYFAISSKRVLTEDALSCAALTFRALQTNDTTITPAQSSVPTNPYSWFIVKDYLAGFDQTYQTLQAQMRDTLFSKNVYKLTTAGEKGFPSTDSVSSQVVDAYSSLNGANVAPTLTYVEPVVDSKSISLKAIISNIDGYLYAGLGKEAAFTPTMIQLRRGQDGNGTSLLVKYYAIGVNRTEVYFNFTNLANKTNYTLFFGASNLDPSINSLNTEVYVKNLKTKDPNNGEILKWSLMLVGFVMMLWV